MRNPSPRGVPNDLRCRPRVSGDPVTSAAEGAPWPGGAPTRGWCLLGPHLRGDDSRGCATPEDRSSSRSTFQVTGFGTVERQLVGAGFKPARREWCLSKQGGFETRPYVLHHCPTFRSEGGDKLGQRDAEVPYA